MEQGIKKEYWYKIEKDGQDPSTVLLKNKETDQVLYKMISSNNNNSWEINNNSNKYVIDVKNFLISSKIVSLLKNGVVVGRILITPGFSPSPRVYIIMKNIKLSPYSEIILNDGEYQFRPLFGANGFGWFNSEKDELMPTNPDLITVYFHYLGLFFPILRNKPEKILPFKIKINNKEISEDLAILSFYSFCSVYSFHSIKRKFLIFYSIIIVIFSFLMLLLILLVGIK